MIPLKEGHSHFRDVTIDGILAYTPIGLWKPNVTGPTAPNSATLPAMEYFLYQEQLRIQELPDVTGDWEATAVYNRF